ncbi:hypothetical protein [Actinomyces lilanjuaniae]|uniref:hypothetical protein n=1 Tax=Actinomyces lilanjuaniae TaxID=2321394 RepID=UPI0013C41510|nr:hypothetical protein [Actinomyces lilanjuaniae]
MSRGVVRHVVVAVCLVVCAVLCMVAYQLRVGAEFRRAAAEASASASAAGVQVGAPYPADVDHLEEILSIEPGYSLPEGARVVSVGPAVRFEEGFPGGWGYVIAFTAEEQAIRDYAETRAGIVDRTLERSPEVTQYTDGVEDVDLRDVSNPMSTRFGRAVLVLERPLGRGWLVIRRGGR